MEFVMRLEVRVSVTKGKADRKHAVIATLIPNGKEFAPIRVASFCGALQAAEEYLERMQAAGEVEAMGLFEMAGAPPLNAA